MVLDEDRAAEGDGLRDYFVGDLRLAEVEVRDDTRDALIEWLEDARPRRPGDGAILKLGQT